MCIRERDRERERKKESLGVCVCVCVPDWRTQHYFSYNKIYINTCSAKREFRSPGHTHTHTHKKDRGPLMPSRLSELSLVPLLKGRITLVLFPPSLPLSLFSSLPLPLPPSFLSSSHPPVYYSTTFQTPVSSCAREC